MLFIVLLCFTLIAPTSTYAATLKLNKTKLSLNVGDTYQLKLAKSSGTIKWSSSKKSVATISSKGKLKAIDKGKAVITATFQSKKYNCSVTVNDKKVDVTFQASLFGGASAEEYVEQFKKTYPGYLKVNISDDEHIVVTIYESYRKKTLKDFQDDFDDYLNDLLSNYHGTFTDINADKQLKKVTLYANKQKFENSLDSIGMIISVSMISDAVQALNLIDIEERECTITILDKTSKKVLYTTAR
jgi:hypothetical protein